MQFESLLTRRDMLKGAGGLSALLLAGSTGACEQVLERIRNRPVRRNIGNLPANDPIIQSYKAAVSAMKGLPGSDGRAWMNQADIHANWCPHGNWYFLPWHRAYLYYFERICRKLSGNPDFALPYWNWQQDRAVPGVFWGSGNPLNHSPRTATPSSQASTNFVGPSVIESILNISENDFFLFASQSATGQRDFSGFGELEGRPHNYIHGFVGGDMGSVPRAARDPVFWCHHAMVDCLWAEWNIAERNRNTNDPNWTGFTFSGNFVDENDSAVDVEVGTTVLMPLLSYRYETSRKGEADEAMVAEDTGALRTFLEQGANVQTRVKPNVQLRRGLTVRIDEPAQANIKLRAETVRPAFTGDGARAILTLDGVSLPPQGDFFVRVFVNRPDADARTPTDDPHYAGSFAFFTGQDMSAMGRPSYLVDVTGTLRRLREMGRISDAEGIGVQLVAVPFPGQRVTARSFDIQGLGLAISPLKLPEQ